MLKMPASVGDLIVNRVSNEDYEVHPLYLVNNYVKAYHRVLEAGAGLGFITRRLSELAQFVIAAEANEELYHCAEENAPEAIVINRVLSGKSVTRIRETAHTGDAFGVGDVSWALPIEADTLIGSYHLNALVLDIEGEEAEVLRKSRRLDDLELVVVEWHPSRCGSIPMTQAHVALLESGLGEVEKIVDGDLIHSCYVRGEV